MTYVLDASALVKMALEQTGTAAFRDWYVLHAAEPKVAPQLLWSEVGRALQKDLRRADASVLAETHRRLLAGIDLRPVAESLAWRHAHNLTFYDAQYVALAETEEATLVTCDRKMAAAATSAGVQTLLL
ncbi:MAG: type II toxin-antitoxin system VapC family toxin [Halobacteriales archaeon]|nr:type II toxin-antitoxin system VapC family toxin [Halobacteriales archaeon]